MIAGAIRAPTISAIVYQAAAAPDNAMGPLATKPAATMAGFAYEEEGVAMIAATSHAPTENGPALLRLARAQANTTIINAVLANYSLPTSCAGGAIFIELGIKGCPNNQLAKNAPRTAPTICATQ
jgi:hypothetical protein